MEKQRHFDKTPAPNLEWLEKFSHLRGPKILLSHHPEYYPKYIKDLGIDLTLSGHAHGGQWRFFNRGVFAPGQGIFPKYTSGLYDGKLIVSRGLGNQTPYPRINNEEEIIVIDIVSY
jgi:predicted MPP superfamily phosphohydrolase